MLERGVEGEWWRRVLGNRVVGKSGRTFGEMCWRELLLEKTVVEKCCTEGLEKSDGVNWWGMF